MKKEVICKGCGRTGHYKMSCPYTARKPIAKKSKLHESVQIKTTKTTKLSRSKVKKQLDKLVKDYVKERDNYTCQHCGKKVEGSNCHASHIFPVGSCSLLQFEPLNMKVLCYHCHINWWHKNPIEAYQWAEKTFPDRIAILGVMKNVNSKISTIELQELVEEYKSKLKDIGK